MYNISLVCTQHKESGICNSLELHNIIEKIRPEIVFEELSYSHFNECYEQKSLVTLETKAIREYLKSYNVKHIPVDTYRLPSNYHEDVDRMYSKLFYSKMSYESYTLRSLIENHAALIRLNGFQFLNSHENIQYFEEFNLLKEKILNDLNEENLLRISRLEKEIITKRENQIIENIYNYSRENYYGTALMFIGSGHGKSIFNVITEFEAREGIKLNWKNYFSQSL